MGEGASFALGPPGPPPHGQGGLLRFGITKAPAASLLRFGTTDPPATWGRGRASLRGHPLLWDHLGPRCMGEGVSRALGSPRSAPREHEGLPRPHDRR